MIVPYVQKIWEDVGEDKGALAVIDNFKGQVTSKVFDLLDKKNIFVCLLPPNTTDLLQPMDLTVNKPAKEYLKRQFEEWYVEEVTKQLQGKNFGELEEAKLLLIDLMDLSMHVMKEVGAKWLVEMADYLSDKPQFVVNGFIQSGITAIVDGVDIDEEELPADHNEESSEDEWSGYSIDECDVEYEDDD